MTLMLLLTTQTAGSWCSIQSLGEYFGFCFIVAGFRPGFIDLFVISRNETKENFREVEGSSPEQSEAQ